MSNPKNLTLKKLNRTWAKLERTRSALDTQIERSRVTVVRSKLARRQRDDKNRPNRVKINGSRFGRFMTLDEMVAEEIARRAQADGVRALAIANGAVARCDQLLKRDAELSARSRELINVGLQRFKQTGRDNDGSSSPL